MWVKIGVCFVLFDDAIKSKVLQRPLATLAAVFAGSEHVQEGS
jgi:hypothetical protein